MSTALQQRAQAFVARPVPADLDYAPGSIAERIINAYARDGRIGSDPELVQLLEIAVMEAPTAAAAKTGAAREYLDESAAILAEIAAQG